MTFVRFPKIKNAAGIFFLGFFVVIGTLISLVVVTKVYAGTMTNASITISDSRAGWTGVSYNIGFTATQNTGIKEIGFQFCTTASGACSAPAGLSVTAVTLSSNNLSGSGISTSTPSANQINVNIGTSAVTSPLGMFTNFTNAFNPTATNASVFVRINTYSDAAGTATIDQVTVAYGILATNSIAVTASVDAGFTFSVAGVTTSSVVNGATTNIGTASTSVPFGTIAANATYIAANDLTVVTNAKNGYKITVSYPSGSYPLSDGSNGISAFTGTNGSPTTWSLPNGTVANTNTGWFGYTTNHAGVNQFSSNKWAGPLTTAANIANSTVPVSTETTRVGWEIEINGIQPAGNYAGTMVLVATPTY